MPQSTSHFQQTPPHHVSRGAPLYASMSPLQNSQYQYHATMSAGNQTNIYSEHSGGITSKRSHKHLFHTNN